MQRSAGPALRLTIALVGVMLALVLAGGALHLMPDVATEALAHRKRTVEALAVQLSSPAMLQDADAVADMLDSVVAGDGGVRSAALRGADDELLVEAGDHRSHWRAPGEGRSTPEFVQVPLFADGEPLGALEVRFDPLPSPWALSLSSGGILAWLLFMACGGALSFFFVLRRSLRILDPSAVVPERVRMVMDSLGEGVIVMDEAQRILLANRAFAAETGVPVEQLIGRDAHQLNWRAADSGGTPDELPWVRAMRTRAPAAGQTLALRDADGSMRTFSVNCTPVIDAGGQLRGAFASFDDVTGLQRQNVELQATLSELQASREAVERNNIELQYLATRDPLTGCLNRRAFFGAFEKAFASAREQRAPLFCAMLDIDHFKQINDRFGHGTGDRVIAYVAETIRMIAPPSGLAGRYGGEEFCLVMGGCTASEAEAMLERIREAVIRGAESRFTSELRLTISGGIAEQRAGDRTAGMLLDRADVALYAAKNAGRDRIVRWNDAMSVDAAGDTRTQRALKGGPGAHWQSRAAGATPTTGASRAVQPGAQDLFRERVSHALSLAARHSWASALLRIELQTAGVLAPQVTHEVLERVAGLLRASDALAQVRGARVAEGSVDAVPSLVPLSATELGVLLPDISDVAAVGRVVQRIVNAIAEPFVVDGVECLTTCTIGVSIAPSDGEDFDTLMQRAEHALRVGRAARNGERYAFYQPSMTAALLRTMRIENGLRRALVRDEFQLFYQPQVSIADGEVCGFEALLRWTDGNGDAVPPAEFIPIAESCGLIGQIGDWVLRTACLQARDWHQASGVFRRIAVNVSAIQIMSPRFAERVMAILKATGVDPRLIEMEITETAFMSDLSTAAATLRELRQLGLHITLDDFGTGYSSLSYLKQLPIDTVKIDSRFIRDLNDTREGVALVTAIVGMAHGLGIRVMAEGVETPEILQRLRQLGCDQAQGYLISPPLPAPDAVRSSARTA